MENQDNQDNWSVKMPTNFTPMLQPDGYGDPSLNNFTENITFRPESPPPPTINIGPTDFTHFLDVSAGIMPDAEGENIPSDGEGNSYFSMYVFASLFLFIDHA